MERSAKKRKPLLLRRQEGFPNVVERPTYNGWLAVNPPQYLHNSRQTLQYTVQRATLAHLPPWAPRTGALENPPLPLRLRATQTPVRPSRHPCRRQRSAYYRRHRQSSRRCYSGRALRRCPQVPRWMCCEICFTRGVARGENDCAPSIASYRDGSFVVVGAASRCFLFRFLSSQTFFDTVYLFVLSFPAFTQNYAARFYDATSPPASRYP